MSTNRIWLSRAHIGLHEQDYIQEAFDTHWVAPLGPNVDRFERDLENYIGEDRKVVALCTGTAAIHIGLLLLGVGAGDEVICQSFTFAASANPVKYVGATPVFVDSEPDTWNMSPFFLEQAIRERMAKTGKKPKAIIPVDLYGMPAKMDEITAIARRYEIPVLEDAAEALGSALNGQACGTFGALACLSFNGNKIITTSGGGALVCSTEAQARKALFLSTQARDEAPHYQHSEVGYNYRMSNICAGIGRGQMEVLAARVERRRAVNQLYRRALGEMGGIRFQTAPSPAYFANYWLTVIYIDPAETNGVTRDDVRLACEADQIETRPLWKPMHLQPVFRDCPFYGDGTSEQLFRNGLCLPSGTYLTDAEIEQVAGCVAARLRTKK